MSSFELKISPTDWLYIIITGALFGTFVSSLVYFLQPELKHISTIFFGGVTAINISIVSVAFISISNAYILPKLPIKFWTPISSLLSFLAGALGFLFNYFIFIDSGAPIISLLKEYLVYISTLSGFMTFLIGYILHLFVSMKYRHEAAEKDILETKIKALEGELNPHFLFNALNSVSELVYQNQEKAESTILKLSKFLRNAINRESLITIKEEIEMTHNYVDIENIRFNNKIKLSSKVSSVIEQQLIPKFSIQLIVENAIKHGFRREDLEISISSDYNNIIISNNGIIPDSINYGTGLSNLQKRLKYLKIGVLSYKKESKRLLFTIELQ